ncbi:MAG: ATP-dependent helicase [Thermoprotei archaeon]|nr:MAG: ATP-dependent helicase [Thermoprotei archaeon]
MLRVIQRPPKEEVVLEYLRPYTIEWFKGKYGSFTPAQLMSIPIIKEGFNVLITSPTGTGKTLAAFLPIIDELYGLAEKGCLEDRVYVIYVSPLRALNNDIKKNLEVPIEGVRSIAEEVFSIKLPKIRVGVRTSDTSQYEKQKMLKEPPHIMITTPESLAIVLVAPKFRRHLKKVRWIIIDEIHELASSKRGAHLSLSLERLEEFVEGEIQRIGLSATIAPLEEVAKFLVGFIDNKPRKCFIVDARFLKPMELEVVCPKDVDIVKGSAEEINNAIYRVLEEVIKEHKTTLVFTNTRSSTERVVYKLRKIFEKNGIINADEIEAHHSSLSREVRLSVEDKLKKGELKAVVCSTSLELGIDIGYIDAVVLLSSPKSVTRLIQRVGRSGHSLSDVSKGYLIAVDRDDLVEVTVLAKLAKERKLDRIRIPRKPLDILAQHIVGMSLERKWRINEAFKVIKRAYNYRDLSFEEFMNVIRYLAGKYGDVFETINVYSKIWYSELEGVFGRKRNVRMIYYLNTGAIPDEAKVRVFLENGRYVGDLEEEFIEYLTPGDVFVLGGRTYEFIRSEGMKVIVRRVEHQRPTVPSWFSEMLPLTFDSALEVGRFRRFVAGLIKDKGIEEAVKEVVKAYGVDKYVAKHIVRYIYEQMVSTGGLVPSDKLVLIELWDDEASYTKNVIFHAIFVRRVNDALSRAYAYVMSNSLGVNVRVTVTDYGFMLTLPYTIEVGLEDIVNIVSSVRSENVREILRRVLRRSEVLKRRFRHCAERAFALLRKYRGSDTSISRRQFNSEILLKISERIPGFPILEEAYREILEDYMDVDNAIKVLKWIESGDVEVKVIRSYEAPSPFSHNIIAHGYSDAVLMEDRRRLLKRLYDALIRKLESR